MKYSRLLLAITFPTVFLVLFMVTLQTKASPSATFTVNSTVDAVDVNPGDGVCETAVGNNVCTLRAAVMETNALNGSDIISLPANTYALAISGQDEDASATGDIDILDDLTINGANATTTIVDGLSLDRVFHITGTNDSTVSISNLTIQNGGFDLNSNVADAQGGGIFNALAGATLLISDSILLNNQSFSLGGLSGGGGINNIGSLQVSNTDIFTNSSPSGHAIFNQGHAIVTGGNFAFNNQGTAGTGTILNHGTLSVEDTHFYQNYSYAGAGVSNGISGNATLDNVSIYSNTVYLDGGGIFNFGTITVTNSAIYDNENTSSPGGGISNYGIFHLINSTIHHNTAVSGFAIGGGISIYDGVVDINNSAVYSNSAGIGGGIYLKDGELLINNSDISGNVANTMGGGIYTVKPLSIENSNISGNMAQEGGGIYMDGAVLTVTTSTIHNNQANSAAGIGLYNTSLGSMQDSTISYNSAITEGGGLFVDSTSTAVITASTFNHNSATNGGGIYNFGQVDATNATISNNSASSEGGGIWHFGSGSNDVTLINLTLAENSAPSGSGIYHENFATIAVTNTIIADNGVENCNLALTATNYSLEDSDDCGLGSSGDQINTNPMLGPLQDNGGSTETHALLFASPAIDSAEESSCPETDQRGAIRPFDGDNDDTAVCDIGAVEYGSFPPQFVYLPLVTKP